MRENPEKRVAPLLGHGAEKAIPTAALVAALGLKDQRQLRLLVERERAAGIIILSSVRGRGGYYLPAEDPVKAREEITGFIHTVHARAVNSQRALRAARRALRGCEGQIEIKCQEAAENGAEESG